MPPLTTLGDEGCTRADATPVLDPARATAHGFHRGMGPRAEETALIAGHIKLRILHTGCEHFVERYVFFVPGDGKLPPPLEMASELVRALPVRGDRVTSAKEWVERLESREAAKPPYAPGEEITVIPNFSWLSVISKSVEGGTELELVYDIAL